LTSDASPESTKTRSYIPGVDGLRAVAVLSVLLFHLDARLLPGGFTGVDVFFVISGYVISRSLASSPGIDFRTFVGRFYARRIRRLFPALVFCLMVVGLGTTLFVPASWLSDTIWKTGLSAFFGFSNFALVLVGDGYFSPRVEFNPFTHTWSLAVEEQFYLLFPVILFPWIKSIGRGGSGSKLGSALLPLLLVASLLVSGYETAIANERAYHLLPSRFWEIACGAMLFRFHHGGRLMPSTRWQASMLVASGLATMAVGFAVSNATFFPFPGALLPVSGSMLVIAGLSGGPRGEPVANALLENSPIVYIGRLSYSLYLWHWSIFVLFKWTFGLEGPTEKIAAVVLTFAGSVLSYHLIEQPFRRSRFAARRSHAYVVRSGLAAIGLCCAISAVVYYARPVLSLSVTGEERTWYPYPWTPADVRLEGDPHDFTGRRLFVLGDSHMYGYQTLFQALREHHGLEVQLFSADGCAVVDLLRPSAPWCVAAIERNIQAIEAVARPQDLVFLASLRSIRLGNQWATFPESDVEAERRRIASARNRLEVDEEAHALVARLERRSITVLIDAPKPVFRSPSFRCSDWFNESNPVCSGGLSVERETLLAYRTDVMASLSRLERRHPLLAVWDPFPELCPSDPCTAFADGMPLFLDGDHLSAHGNRVLYASFVSVLRTVW